MMNVMAMVLRPLDFVGPSGSEAEDDVALLEEVVEVDFASVLVGPADKFGDGWFGLLRLKPELEERHWKLPSVYLLK